MFPKLGAKQAQRLHAARGLSEGTVGLKCHGRCARRNSSCATLIFVMWSMSGCVAGGTEMSSADFLYLHIFLLLFLEKGSPYWSRIHRFFCKWVLFCFSPQTPLVTDFQWWKGSVAELLSLNKESRWGPTGCVSVKRFFSVTDTWTSMETRRAFRTQGKWEESFIWGYYLQLRFDQGLPKSLVNSTLGNWIFISV